MSRPTVCAVMTVTIEIPVRASGAGETFEQMHNAAKSEAEGILRNSLPADKFRVVGPVTFSHATVKEFK
jgi:hypothetical protein